MNIIVAKGTLRQLVEICEFTIEARITLVHVHRVQPTLRCLQQYWFVWRLDSMSNIVFYPCVGARRIQWYVSG